jgi:molecular chaperone DnaK (HSP70)
MADENFYLGIDLGTTNSSIHWGAINPATNVIEPKELAYDQLVGDGTMQRRGLLTSFIYFKQGDPHPIVGEYARHFGMMGQASRVARSVKSHMGDAAWRFSVDGRSYSAAQLSAILLQTMLAGIRSTWGMPVTDVVITVPASFDSDMREDTLVAARSAGFKTREASGEVRNLLLDEPRASLYDLLNQQRAGQLPTALIDFSTSKTVLVFDLGGGTLDVSLHRVVQDTTSYDVSVDDLAISRYTQLGGDVFDQLIADELQRRFEDRHKLRLSSLNPTEQQIARFALEGEAERAKRRLTTDIEQRLSQGVPEVDGSYAVDIHRPYVADNKGLFTQLSKADLEAICQPLLGQNLTLDHVHLLDQIDEVATRNIIYPILDVLQKAQKRENSIPKVDAVILSGGMTRIHAIRERLHRLFGIRPLTVLDPELSVSRGACIYHYLLHRGHRPKQILAESLGIEVHGNRVHQLIPAGTVLPVRQHFPDLFEVPNQNATVIRLPLYRGEGKEPVSPNRKILERRFVLDRPQPAGAPIDVEVRIDDNKMVRFVAHLRDRPDVRIVVDTSVEGAPQSSDPSPISAPTPVVQPTGPAVDITWLRGAMRKADGEFDMAAFRALEPQILKAPNYLEVTDMLLQEVNVMRRIGRSRAIFVLGELGATYPNHPRRAEIVQVCLRYLQPKFMNVPQDVTVVARNCVVSLGKMGEAQAEGHLVNLLIDTKVDSIRSDILQSIGKCGSSLHALRHVQRYITSERKGERIASLWTIGKLGSRERPAPLPIRELRDLVKDIVPRTVPKIEPHPVARQYAVYALGEICDRRSTLAHDEVVDHEISDLVIEVLKRVETSLASPRIEAERQIQRAAGLSLRMAQGETLSANEAEMLMALRTLLGASSGETAT